MKLHHIGQIGQRSFFQYPIRRLERLLLYKYFDNTYKYAVTKRSLGVLHASSVTDYQDGSDNMFSIIGLPVATR